MAHHAHTHPAAALPDHMSSEGSDDHISRTTYIVVFIALMVGLVLTMAAWRIPFHKWGLGPLGIVVAFFIASIKAVLVVLYFMHVRHSNRLTKIFVVSGLFWLGILIFLTLNDYLTRDWLPSSRGWDENPVKPPPPAQVEPEH